jgi:hypothetical protein
VPYQGMDAINKFRKRFSDCGLGQSISILNECCTEIFSAIPYRRTQLTVPLVLGQSEYAFGGGYAKAWSVQYIRSSASGDYIDLDPTSTDELDADVPGWRQESPGEPTLYYTSSDDVTNCGVLGLYVAPDTATTGGYPILKVDASVIPLFVKGTEALPDVPFVIEAVADMMCFRRAKDVKLDVAATWAQVAAESFERLQHVFWIRNARKQQEIRPAVGQRREWTGNLNSFNRRF